MHLLVYLPYGWRAGNLNGPIRIQQAGKILVSCCYKSGIENQATFLTGHGVKYPRKEIFNFKTILVGKK